MDIPHTVGLVVGSLRREAFGRKIAEATRDGPSTFLRALGGWITTVAHP